MLRTRTDRSTATTRDALLPAHRSSRLQARSVGVDDELRRFRSRPTSRFGWRDERGCDQQRGDDSGQYARSELKRLNLRASGDPLPYRARVRCLELEAHAALVRQPVIQNAAAPRGCVQQLARRGDREDGDVPRPEALVERAPCCAAVRSPEDAPAMTRTSPLNGDPDAAANSSASMRMDCSRRCTGRRGARHAGAGRLRIVGSDELLAICKRDGLRAAADSELAHDVLEVRTDGPAADEQLLGDLGRLTAVGEQA